MGTLIRREHWEIFFSTRAKRLPLPSNYLWKESNVTVEMNHYYSFQVIFTSISQFMFTYLVFFFFPFLHYTFATISHFLLIDWICHCLQWQHVLVLNMPLKMNQLFQDNVWWLSRSQICSEIRKMLILTPNASRIDKRLWKRRLLHILYDNS